MKTILPLRIATAGTITILTLIIMFHLLVICSIVPVDIVWGGNIADKNQLLLMESISIVVNLIMLLFVSAYSGMTRVKASPMVFKVGFWIMFILFLLNTLGNILSTTLLETYIFTPLTLLLSLFCLRIATSGPTEK